MTARLTLQLLLFIVSLPLMGQSGLNQKDFKKYWKVESESPDYRVTFRGDTCELLSPKGLTLWRKQQLSMRVSSMPQTEITQETYQLIMPEDIKEEI